MGGRGGRSRIRSNGSFGRMPDLSGYLQFLTQGEAEQWHLANSFDWDKWRSLLNDLERNGIIDYTGSWYSSMNTDLREGRLSPADVQQRIDGATSGLSKWLVQKDMITFRGANYHWTANLLGGTEAQLSDPAFLRKMIGKTVTDKGFMSAGTHEDSSWYADVQYTILTRKGVSGMYVDAISRNAGEYEFLYNRNTSFVVRSIKTDSNGKISELVIEAKPKKKKAPDAEPEWSLCHERCFKRCQDRLHPLIQIAHCGIAQVVRDTIERLGNAARDSSQRIAVTADGDGITDRVLKIRGLEESHKRLRNRPLAGFSEGVRIADAIQREIHRVIVAVDLVPDLLDRAALPGHEDGHSRCFRALDALRVVMGYLSNSA